jgi:hypothetical protein
MSRRKLCRLTLAQLRLLPTEINERTEVVDFSGLAPGSPTGSFLRRLPAQNHPLPSSSIRGYDFSETV